MLVGYLDNEQERFFTWCDNVAQANIERDGVEIKAWWPRKNKDGSYDLVLELAIEDKTPFKRSFSVPDEFHELLEREYFIDHPPDKED
ncbi:MAG: hypothetical protein ACOX6X_00155 [Dethiobacteria bacterium]|jgi:hypothetical protein